MLNIFKSTGLIIQICVILIHTFGYGNGDKKVQDIQMYTTLACRGGQDRYESRAREGNSNSLQFMITQKMRQILQSELGYLAEEVDEMEPQIAAVVIEKNLNRPSKGMPPSWKKKGGSRTMEKFKMHFKRGFQIGRLVEKFKYSTNKISQPFKRWLIPATPLIFVIPMIVLNYGYISSIMYVSASGLSRGISYGWNRNFKKIDNIYNSILKMTSKTWLSIMKFNNKPKGRRLSKSPIRINLNSFEKVGQKSFMDHITLHYNIMQRRLLKK